jgi:hypothetical protein
MVHEEYRTLLNTWHGNIPCSHPRRPLDDFSRQRRSSFIDEWGIRLREYSHIEKPRGFYLGILAGKFRDVKYRCHCLFCDVMVLNFMELSFIP